MAGILAIGVAAWLASNAAMTRQDAGSTGHLLTSESRDVPSGVLLASVPAPGDVQPMALPAPAESPAPMPTASVPRMRSPALQASDSQPLPVITLLITDESGQPLPGARVEVWDSASLAGGGPDLDSPGWDLSLDFGTTPDPRTAREPALSAVIADARGKCTPALPSRAAVFVATMSPEGAPVLSSGVCFARDLPDKPAEVNVALHPMGFACGSVLWADGSIAPHVDVRFLAGYSPSHLDPGVGMPRCPPDTRSDDKGRFSVPADRFFRGRACAVWKGIHSPISYVGWQPTEHSTNDRTTLRFPGRLAVRGTVTGPDHQPIAGAVVTLYRRLVPPVRATSDEHGQYEAALPGTGRYALVADVPQHQSMVMANASFVTITESTPVARANVTFIEGLSISGIVGWDDGTPVPNAKLTATPEWSAGDLSREQARELGCLFARTDADGDFTMPNMSPKCSYVVSCLGKSVQGVRPGTEDLRIVFSKDLRAGGTIEGTVSDARSGRPLEVFDVTLRYRPFGLYDDIDAASLLLELPKPLTAQRSSGGRFRFSEVPLDGLYTVAVESEGHVSGCASPINIGAGAAELRIALDPVASLIVHVADAEGASVPGARVIVLKPDTQPIPTLHFLRCARIETDSEGRVMLDQLAHGTYVVQAFAGTAHSAAVGVELALGASVNVELRLAETPATGELTITVLQPGGKPMDGATVVANWTSAVSRPAGLKLGSESNLTATTSKAGSVHFDHVQPGIYYVSCNDLDRGLGSTVGAVDGSHPASITLQTF